MKKMLWVVIFSDVEGYLSPLDTVRDARSLYLPLSTSLSPNISHIALPTDNFCTLGIVVHSKGNLELYN
jgi:hypothetical protein